MRGTCMLHVWAWHAGHGDMMGTSASSEPYPRFAHCSAAAEGKLYVWGGRGGEPTSLHVFDPMVKSWETKSTTGDPPTGVLWSASASAGHHLYQYGGAGDGSYQGSLHHLDTTTLCWTELPSGPVKRKGCCGMVICGDMLILLGGVSEEGSTDELHVFDLKTGKELY